MGGGGGGGLVVVGGGASGIFAAIAAARRGLQVTVLEQGKAPLRKVLASGGGRCNVMHDVKPARELVRSYPRGERELIGPFSARFSPEQTRQWFEDEGVELKVERDGRVFPRTDDAETIAGALRRAAEAAGVRTVLGAKVSRIGRRCSEAAGAGARFSIEYEAKRSSRSLVSLDCSAVLLSTGSAASGYQLARRLGHTLVKPYPSLFSFRVPMEPEPEPEQREPGSAVLAGLAGVVLSAATLTLELPQQQAAVAAPPTQHGPLLVTHRGLSGPAALRLSAFAAAELRDMGYEGTLILSSVGGSDGGGGSGRGKKRQKSGVEAARALRYCRGELAEYAKAHATQQIVNAKGARPFADAVPKRWWGAIAKHAIGETKLAQLTWAHLRKDELEELAQALACLRISFRGKDTNKDEFVSAGGVSLKEVDLAKMESKLVSGLYFSGELLDVDGVTGGFNFQAAWTTGHVAGEAAAAAVEVQCIA
jgi:predicted Rossmann fold flavoprotein